MAGRDLFVIQETDGVVTGGRDLLGDRGKDDTLSFSEVVGGAISNTPRSAKRFIKDLVSPFLSPVQTAKAVGSLGKGVAQKFIPGEQEDEKIVDALGQMLKERYGGVENLKRTLAEDPVGAVGDIATILTGGGALVKGLGTLGKVGGVARAGETVSKIGKALEPATAATKSIKGVAQKIIPEGLPSELFQSAAKFSTAIPQADRVKLAQTALDNRITPTLKGLDKTREKINKFNDEITVLIDTATEAGEKIPVNRLFAEFGELKKTISSEPLTRKRQIGNVAREINKNFKDLGKKTLTPKEAQQLKQAVYRETEGFYNSVKNSPAKIQAKQAVAKAAKDAIEEIFPEVKQLNKQEGALIELRKQLEKSASRISNRDLIGIGTPIKGVAGGAAAGLPGVAGGLALGLFDTPQVKAKLAIVLNSLKKKGVALPDDSLLKKILDTEPEAVRIASRQAGVISEQQEDK